MVGANTGVATCIIETESHAHLSYCHGHALQLAVGITSKAMRGTLDVAFEMNLMKYFMVQKS